MPLLDWAQVNTVVLVAALAFLWRQSRVLDQLRQAVLGIGGQGGVMAEVTMLRKRTHDLSSTMMQLNGSIQLLTSQLQAMQQRITLTETWQAGRDAERRRPPLSKEE